MPYTICTMRSAAALLLLVISTNPATAQLARPPYAITNAKVVTAPGKTIENATILVRDGIIENVGTNLTIPPDMRIFEASGVTVYPGLIDGATHYGFPVAVARPGVLPPATPPAPPTEDVNSPDRYLRPQPTGVNADVSAAARMTPPTQPDPRRNQGFTTVLSIPRDGHWQGSSALVNLSSPDARAIVLTPVAMHVNFTLAPAAPGIYRYPSSLMGVFAVLRQTLLNAQAYREAKHVYEAAGRSGLPRPNVDPTSEALLPVLDGKLPVVFTADSAESIRRAIRFADEFKLKPMILGGVEAWKVADVLKARDIPVLVSIALQPATQGRPFSAAADPAEPPVNSLARIAAEENPGMLEKSGVRWAFVTGGFERPEQIRDKIRTAIRRGLGEDAALRALTTSPAEILGASAQLGSIEKGKVANLALAEGDILQPRTRVRGVMIDGEFYFPTALLSVSRSGVRSPAELAAEGTASRQQTPTTDDPAPPTPRGAKPDSTTANPLPERRPPDPEAAPRDLVIRNATILTVTKGTIPNGSIWLHEGKIQEVGPTVKAPADAKIIEGTGRFVMPGIIDSHSHTAISGGVNEMGPSVTAQCRITDVINPDDVDLYREAAGGVTTLNILHGSANAIGGQNATVKVKWGSPVEQMLFPGAPRGIKMALGENPKRSNGNRSGTRFPNTRMGVEEVIRETFKAGRQYKLQWEAYEAKVARGEKAIAPERNLTLDAIRDILDGKVLVHAHCYRADEISMLLDLADEYGFKIRSLQHVLEGYKVADKIRKHGAGASTFADFWGYKMEAFDGTAYNAALLVKAGVRTAVNSDSDERARRLYTEAAKAIKYGGLSEEQALRLITTEPAWMLGVEKRVGALEPGMDGDLAVFNAHPFSPYARVEMTLVDGQVIFDRERDLKSRVPWRPEFETNATVPTSDGDEEELR